jgi:hypothetical protein
MASRRKRASTDIGQDWVAQVFKSGVHDSILVRVIAGNRAPTNRRPLGPGESIPRV